MPSPPRHDVPPTDAGPPQPRWRPRTLVALVAMAVLVLTLRRDLPLVGSGPAAFILALAVGAQAQAVAWMRSTAPRLAARGWPPSRPLWVLPLAALVAQVALLLAALHASTRDGRDLLPRLLDLPTPVVARLVEDLAFLLALGTATAFLALASDLLARRRGELATGPAPSPRDAAATAAVLGSGAVMAALLVHWQLAMPDNLLLCRALAQLTVAGHPREALATLSRLTATYPASPLADSALFRAGRILEEELGEPVAALATYRRLLAEHGDTPWRDDAAYRAAALLLALPGRSAEAREALEGIPRAWPRSPYADDALGDLAGLAAAEGDPALARSALERLAREYPGSRRWRPDPATYPWWIRDTLAEATAAVAAAGVRP